MTQVTIHDQAYEYYSWQQLGEAMFDIAKRIIESERTFDRVIALAKGGLTFSRSLVDYLDVKDISTFQIEFYSGIGTTNKTPVITQSLPVAIKDERVLVFDDVVDHGETMKMATQYLQYHGAAEITTSALIQKPWSTFKVDFVAQESEAWVIFPNEARESIKMLSEMWTKKGDSPDQIAAQLAQIGFPPAEVALFTTLK